MKIYIIILTYFIHFSLVAQEKVFELNGISDFYNSKELIIEPVLNALIDSGYVACEITNRAIDTPVNVVKVVDNRFNVKGILDYPIPFAVSFYSEELNQGHTSEPFL